MGTFIPLGKDVLGLILRQLDVEDILTFGLTSKFVHAETTRPHLWAFLVERDFAVDEYGDDDPFVVYKDERRFKYGSEGFGDGYIFYCAVVDGDFALTKCCLRHTNSYDNRAFTWSVNNLSLFTFFLKDKRFDPCEYKWQLLERICINNAVAALNLLLEDGRFKGRLNEPVRRDRPLMLKIILNHGVDDYDVSYLQHAAMNGYTEIVRILLEDGHMNPAADDNYALRYAVRHGHVEIATILLRDERVSVCPQMLIDAGEYGQTKMALFLLEGYEFDKGVVEQAIGLARTNRHKKTVKKIANFY